MSSEWDKREAEAEKLKEDVKSLGHIPEYKSEGSLCDSFICSCGWRSKPYWDFGEAAYDEWVEHAKKVLEADQASIKFTP